MPLVTFLPQAQQIEMPEGSTILEAADALGLEIEIACTHGICGTDRILVHKGQVYPPQDGELDTLEQRDFPENTRMACQTRIKGDVTVEIVDQSV